MDQAEFRRQYLGEFHVDPPRRYFADLLEEYNQRSEAYDQTVCSGSRDGIAVPMTPAESALISHHARNLKAELLARASRQYGSTALECALWSSFARLDVYWHDARKSKLRG
jgi:hypothetical protein